MRWKIEPHPRDGDIREMIVFALLPTRIVGNIIVWLERYVEVSRFYNSDMINDYRWIVIERRSLK